MWAQEVGEGLLDNNLYNLYGTSPNGTKTTKLALNANKVATLRAFMEKQMPHGANTVKCWGEIVTAIHKRISYLGHKD